MNNTLILSIYLAFIAAMFIIFISSLKLPRTYFVKASLLFQLLIFLWFLCEITMLMFPGKHGLVEFLFDFKLVFVSLAAVAIFASINGYYNIEKHYSLRFKIMVCIVPMITSVLSLTNPFHSLLAENFEILSETPLLIIEYVRTPWYYFSTIYCFALVFFALIIAYLRYKDMPENYRKGSGFIFVCGIVFFLFSAVQILDSLMARVLPTLDLSLCGAGAASVVLYVFAIGLEQHNYVYINASNILNVLDDVIFILDSDLRMLEANDKARKACEFFGVESGVHTYNEMISELEKEGKINLWTSKEGTQNLSVLSTKYPLVYEQTIIPFDFKGASNVGKYVIFKEITKEKLAADRLESLAGRDGLTGLPNRHRYEELLRQLDRSENLPFSVVMCDLNGLKTANDSYGHMHGDAMLKASAMFLQDNCPENGHVCRVGGDEFVLLLPCRNENDTRLLIEQMQAKLEANNMPTKFSIAFGQASKTETSQNIKSLIAEADKNMYKNKKAIKAALLQKAGQNG